MTSLATSLATVGVGAAVPALLGSAVHFYRRVRQARHQLAILQRLGGSEGAAQADLLGTRPQRLAHSPRLQRLLRDVPFVAQLAEMLEQSGLATTVVALLGQIAGSVVGTFVVASAAGVRGATATLLGLMAAAVPLFVVSRACTLRAAAFEAQLPQALELIALYLRSGRSLPQAFLAATEELLPPAGEEFASCAEEYRLGRPLEDALRRLAQKYPGSVGFRLFSVAVSVLGQTGGNLVEVLERIKKTLAATTAYGQRLRALTGESRTSAWILGMLPGGFLAGAAILNPAYFNAFFDSAGGHVMLLAFFLLWSGGVLWIRSLMRSGGA